MTQPADRILWLLISTTLLALVVPGVALFYGGMVRRKNVINTMALPFAALVSSEMVWRRREQPGAHQEVQRHCSR
jgi:ammonium transporter, Amt family